MGSDPAYVAAEYLHVILGMIWLGGGVMMLFVVVRVAGKDGRVAQFRATLAIGKIIGPFFMAVSILVVVTGVIYMGMKYTWDLGVIWGRADGRLIIISLILVMFSIVLGAAGAPP